MTTESKITLFIDGEPLELTLKQARKFYDELNGLFGQDNACRERERIRALQEPPNGLYFGAVGFPRHF